MFSKKQHRLGNEVNAGSMADIAFLLLIFFLVTTQINFDKGILVKLPPWDDQQDKIEIANRNTFSVKINRENLLLLEGELATVKSIRPRIKSFVLNPTRSKQLASAPNKAVVSLQNDRGTNYDAYLQVYNEIKAAYQEMWNDEAMQTFGVLFKDLPKTSQERIKKKIPSVISESEPTSF